MDLRVEDLRLFAEVVDANSFSGAARRLGVPRPTVSRRIAALEAQVGVRLLWRTTRQMRPTDVGLELYGQCQRVLASLEDAQRVVAQAASVPSGHLRIAAAPIVGSLLLGDVVHRFVEEFPAVRVEVQVLKGRVDLRAGGYDLAIRVGTVVDESLVARPVSDLEYWLCAAPAYLSTAGAPKRPRDLASHRLLVFHRHDEVPTIALVRTGRRVELKVQPAFASNDYAALKRAAIAGHGIATLPAPMCTEPFTDGRLESVLPTWALPSDPIAIVYRSGPLMSPKLAAFLERLDAHLEQVELPCIKSYRPRRRRATKAG